ncbi:DUF6356 family protein [Pararoseomonas indoligenes]|uniref:Capsule biosynthesis protein n=1 Tax=Roseomonas indoligenes TaxID=2820811 RepID=A0A940S5B5_9PROT|nr:DUF6356 family protein [Pararoseomonas indoligenes]MBP0494231.1 hypothetical protein [Pararoseomonas indoligenes]
MALPSFTEHPAAVGESYAEHMHTASWFGWQMLLGAGACFVHALLPFLFTRTGSAKIALLHDRMVANRVKATNRHLVPAE